jgi:16S rRNA C967 or C1407 C5-methylase (RsmB/RsmF family)
MKNKGEVIAFDKNKSKMKILQKLKKEQNLEILKVFTQNATSAIKDGYKSDFDRILLDAPCSGLGLRPCFQ